MNGDARFAAPGRVNSMPMSRESKVDRIHKTSMFRIANNKTLRSLAQVLDEVEIGAGRDLIT